MGGPSLYARYAMASCILERAACDFECARCSACCRHGPGFVFLSAARSSGSSS
ncbi:MAG: hypothetical protein MZU95_08465 [Desulfomicrobium escambiense]|nr:hypothetical protein [Desulfomicrobium escambiense]